MFPCRILLVDDSVDFLDIAERLLGREPEFEVVGRARSGQEALEKAPFLRPDLVLMDWVMPGLNGLEATRVLKAQPDAPRVVILTLYDLPEYRAAAAAARADGFVAKAEFSTQLLPLLRTLLRETGGREEGN